MLRIKILTVTFCNVWLFKEYQHINFVNKQVISLHIVYYMYCVVFIYR